MDRPQPVPPAGAPASTTSVAYLIVDSPIGPLLLAATDVGLVRLAFAHEGFDQVLEVLASQVGPASGAPSPILDAAVRELEEYFAGVRQVFQIPLDLRLSTGFRRTVQEFLPQIGYGRTLTYTEVAREVGNPGAVRAVGSSCATNPLPILVPCHRVLRSDGSLGGYSGGLETKQVLLAMEREYVAEGA
ncbi:methylated-DNA-[protein]-cysteine S-methyltransferase [Raineyella antarctica]|uniref:Methylated-DNA--protein-cysteine methyltransferase n=1 Tax=Raineyella antarctica TaxID=1577474 RepID=A0A1G6GLV2_9ACTN|nr:methylated-DNA--[protein]-cysteine S-methyltransferase [Raineyella antarctica]SDB82715.1 methylated-DNA-[protein]-cysteine S-methyltransferase [Raineyella antarctica]